MKRAFLFIAVAIMMAMILIPGAVPAEAAEDTITLRVHYYRPDGNYEGWNLWAWDLEGASELWGISSEDRFSTNTPSYKLEVDNGEAISVLQVPSSVNTVGYIIRYGHWEDKDVEYDQFINLTGIESGTVDFYITSGVPTQPASSYPGVPSVDELISNGFMAVNSEGEKPPVYNDELPDEPEQTPISVYALVPDDWTDVQVWAWDEHLNILTGSAWPGDCYMTPDEDGWYHTELPAQTVGLLLSCNGGEIFTMDIFINDIKSIYIVARYDYDTPFYADDPDDLISKCPHSTHDTNGYCEFCQKFMGHEYDLKFTCKCGDIVRDLKTVYFQNSTSFKYVYCYWDKDSNTGYDKDHGNLMYDRDNDLYYCRVPAVVEYVTFHNGEDTYFQVPLSGVTDSMNVYDPANNQWLFYADVAVPEVEEPSIDNKADQDEPIDSTSSDTPSENEDAEKDEDEDDDDRDSSDRASDRTWLFFVIAVAIVAAMAVILVVILLKKKNT